MKKPEPNDYGFTNEEYQKLLKKKKELVILNSKLDKNILYIIRFALLHILLWFLLMLIEYLIFTHLLKFTYKFNFIKKLCRGAFFSIILGFIENIIRRKIINKKINAIYFSIQKKKWYMLEKYSQDLKKFNENKKNVPIYINKLTLIGQKFYKYSTKELKELAKDLYVNCNISSNSLFDFYTDKFLIKCCGSEAFITKIEIEEMFEYLTTSNFEKIIIFADNDSYKEIVKSYNNIEYFDSALIRKVHIDNLTSKIEEYK